MTLKIHSTEAERLAEYRICKERGHVEGRSYNSTDNVEDTWRICKWCGTHWRDRPVVIKEYHIEELYKPEGAE